MYIEDLTNPIPQQSLKYGNKMIGFYGGPDYTRANTQKEQQKNQLKKKG